MTSSLAGQSHKCDSLGLTSGPVKEAQQGDLPHYGGGKSIASLAR
ncbi:MAG TPA: hypothetical protein VGB55_12330 [Tepidisphaeraceae bacterium]